MLKIHRFRSEKAQGMVEFALILPLLLLLIFGIIGLGHLFFSYITTVNASREAARYGSAVGETENGIPAFQDCDAIITHAVDLGELAGVSQDTIAISYDRGDPATEYGSCLPGNIGPNVPLGDRIVVRMSVPYHPIVPLIQMPTMNLQAETRRTIIRELAVGEVPTAEPLCALTSTTMTVGPEPSVVGQFVDVTVNIVSDSGDDPTDADSVAVSDTNGHTCTLDAPGGTCQFQYKQIGEFDIHAEYPGYDDVAGCWEPSALDYDDPGHTVNPATTITTITADTPDPSKQGNSVPVTVNVQAVAPGQRDSWAGAKVTVADGFATCTITLDAGGNGSCPIGMTVVGMHTIVATFAGDANFGESSDTESHLVVAPPPIVCPSASAINFATTTSGFHFDVMLPNAPGAVPLDVVSVRTEWPDNPMALLNEIRFDGGANIANSCSDNKSAPNCVWYVKKNGGSPLNFLVDSGSDGWVGGDMQPGQSKQMRLMFNHVLPTGPFKVTIEFTSSCVLEVSGTR